MAWYEFVCEEHGQFNGQMPMKDATLESERPCPKCGKASRRKGFNRGTGICMEGFHQVDYAGGMYSPANNEYTPPKDHV